MKSSGFGISPSRGPFGGAIAAAAATGLAVSLILSVLPGLPLSASLSGLGLFATISLVVLRQVETSHPHSRFGTANRMTMMRAGGTSVLASCVLAPDILDGARGWVVVAFVLLLLALDGFDGWIARRQKLASRFGARFDLEIDALLILVLSALVAALGKASGWILCLGLMRYAFLAALWIWPRLDRALYPSIRRKTVCVVQVAILALLLTPPVGPNLATPLGAGALALLVWSFARDLRWLATQRAPGLAPSRIHDLRTFAGVLRSLAIYRARPWRNARLARFYATFIAPGDLAFDIGAHAGNRALALRRAGARVVALEPQAAFHAFLARTLPPDITLLPLAVGPAAGRARLAVSRLHPTVSSLSPGFAERMRPEPGFAHVVWDRSEGVEVTTLDALIAAHGLPRFVKIDVEGFEAEVLRGLTQPVPMIAFEYLPATLDVARTCVARLATLAPYRFNMIVGETQAFALADWCDAAAFLPALARIAATGRSGDVYASLADAPET